MILERIIHGIDPNQGRMTEMRKHWTEKMFVDNPDLFKPRLVSLQEAAVTEVGVITKLLKEQGATENSLILDLGCGIGRHALLLAERDFRVVGVDISPDYIDHARLSAEKTGVQDNSMFVVGDMRAIKDVLPEYTGRFNACINFFTSLGFWDRETDNRILKQLYDLTASGGVFIIDITNRDWIVKNFQRTEVTYQEDGIVQTAERSLDLETSRMHNVWNFYRSVDEDLKHIETINVDHVVYSLHELKALIESVGWVYQTCYGGFELEPVQINSRRLILVAVKP